MQTSSAMQPSTMQSILSSLQQNQQYNSTCHDGNSDTASELQGEALVHKTYVARLMGGEASAPAAATSVLQFMGCTCCKPKPRLEIKCIYHQKVHVPALNITDAVGKGYNAAEISWQLWINVIPVRN
ncbi:hypothetical protein KIW84_013327 [Lathyrus oleraceus]|uniref:Uncharacterized protein n=1 Tax=Pisum sativum TaxID=3888 RepID=A0A9D5GXW7_PEA|nr:hypothetical protein KIW84_013327 [Pisum sativum]